MPGGVAESAVHQTADSSRGSGPTYFADGRISRFSRFCSRMCAAQPAVRAQVNMLVNSGAGTSAWSSTTAELDVRREHAVRLARLELRRRRLLERLGDLEAGRADLARRAAQHRGARVLGAVDAVAEPHQPLALVER